MFILVINQGSATDVVRDLFSSSRHITAVVVKEFMAQHYSIIDLFLLISDHFYFRQQVLCLLSCDQSTCKCLGIFKYVLLYFADPFF